MDIGMITGTKIRRATKPPAAMAIKLVRPPAFFSILSSRSTDFLVLPSRSQLKFQGIVDLPKKYKGVFALLTVSAGTYSRYLGRFLRILKTPEAS